VSYILVDDVDAVAERVERYGGVVRLDPMDVVDSGRMAMIQDPSGGSVALWQAGTHRGAERFNDPGCMTWNELMTRDPLAARAFYSALLGWTFEEADLGPRGTYHLCRIGDRPNGGIMAFPSEVPADVPPYWNVYFAVEDVSDSCAKAESLGATVVVPPTTIPMGTFALVADPRGAHFTLWREG
ncbi:MAG: VOC family protein, partial [Gemmatimonadetes bacterium]|nr:VOC family protein [Gemmatimonadota bacterium]